MKIFLFGGAEIEEKDSVPRLLKLIEKVILDCQPQQVLHIPFARIVATEVEWEGEWFKKYIEIGDIKYLNAQNQKDIARANKPLLFLSGGGNNINLLEKIKADKKLLEFVNKSEYIIGESAGAKILATYFRAKGGDNQSQMLTGLNLIKDTVIQPHYTQRNRQELLVKDMQETGVKYGLGIDSLTGVGFEVNSFPKNIEKFGDGAYELKIKK